MIKARGLLVLGLFCAQVSIAEGASPLCAELFTLSTGQSLRASRHAELLQFGEVPFSLEPVALEKLESHPSIGGVARSQLLNFFERHSGSSVFRIASPARSEVGSIDWVFVAPLTSDVMDRLVGDRDCGFALCHDEALRLALKAEIQSGRIVLMTHSFNGFNGAAFKSTTPAGLMSVRNGKGSHRRSVLIITPATTRSILEHERRHMDDYEQGDLKELHKVSQRLYQQGGLTARQASHINVFIAELRAYSCQLHWLVNNPRKFEFRHERELKGNRMVDRVSEIEGSVFLKAEYQLLSFKIDHYLAAAVGAFKASRMKESDRQRLLDAMSASLTSPSFFSERELRKIFLAP